MDRRVSSGISLIPSGASRGILSCQNSFGVLLLAHGPSRRLTQLTFIFALYQRKRNDGVGEEGVRVGGKAP